MPNFYEDNADLRWYVAHGIDWGPLVAATEYDYRAPDAFANAEEAVATYEDVLRMLGEFSAEVIAPRAAEIDREHPKLVRGEVEVGAAMRDIFAQLGQLGLHGMCVPRELGGMNLPMLLMNIQHELMARADVSVNVHNGFHGGVAVGLVGFSVFEGTTEVDREGGRIVKTRFQDAIAEIIDGKAWGAMDITEPDAGSDMAALRTKGEQDADGNWFVTGQKVFITSGHGKYHLVIAKTEPTSGPDAVPGLDAMSFFLVETYQDTRSGRVREHTSIDGLEDKLGHHGSATVTISFDRAPAHLIGQRGEGFRYMLKAMNAARVGVGFEALGLCETAYRAARDYAAERRSMGKTLDRHEMIADYLDEMRTDLQGIRAMAMAAGFHAEMAQKLELEHGLFPPADVAERDALARDAKRHERKARAITPLLKYYAAEKSVEIARRSIQIHGGAGYMREQGVERLLRDAMVFPIYEGTSQIQALMAMKDQLGGIVKRPQAFFRHAARTRWTATTARDRLERRVAKLRSQVDLTLLHLVSKVVGAKAGELRHHSPAEWKRLFSSWDPKRDFAQAMLHAERLTRMLTDACVAELLLAQRAKDPARAEVLERWLERAEPRCDFEHAMITKTGGRLLEALRPTPALAEAG
ncbi:MAG: hypothetical protein EP329_21680 [Deltaproteobacteria bacterium]|nr:MAG: hypothetical protein EP329_21680 [Deltaproteobacteria bacterium]